MNKQDAFNKMIRAKKPVFKNVYEFRLLLNYISMARKRRNWTVTYLADKVQLHRATIHHLEKGRSSISAYALLKVLQELGFLKEIEQLIEDDKKGRIIQDRNLFSKEIAKSYKM